jgi:hypothetical protein
VLAAVYLVWAPESQDLAAAIFRADTFSEHGFAIWSNDWYSGHYLLSYSVLSPPLGALLGVRLSGALAAVVAAAVFAALIGRRGEPASLVASLWFAFGICAWLLTGRIPFLVAVPFGLGALLAADRGRPALAGALAALASLASPVAGLFAGIAGVAIALAGERLRGLSIAVGAGIPIAALNLAFPTGGEEPFVFSAFIAIPLLAAVVLWLVPRDYEALRIGAVLYALLALAGFLIATPIGGNITRLGALLAGPVLALVLWPRGRLVVVCVSLPLLYWQLIAPVRDVRKAAGDPSTERAFYEPLVAELDRIAADGESFRVEIPPTKNRFESAYVAPEHPIARGWLRQLESEDFELFTGGHLTANAYRDWLERHGVGYVAVPNASRDYLAEDEVELIETGLSYLVPIWSDADWSLYRVDPSQSPEDLVAVDLDRFTIDAAEPGEYPTKINWTPYWRVTGGDACLREAADGSTLVESRAPDQAITVGARLSGDSC